MKLHVPINNKSTLLITSYNLHVNEALVRWNVSGLYINNVSN